MTRLPPIESAWAKHVHACGHVDELKVEIDRVMDPKKDPLHVNRKVEGNKVVTRVTQLPNLREAALIFGDAISDFRAALDHLTWGLVKMGTNPRLAPKAAQKVQFPFANSAADFRASAHRQRRAPGISDEQWQIMGLYQPYKHGKRGRAMRYLRQISDAEKHRRITPTVSFATAYNATLTAIGCKVVKIDHFPPQRALYVGAKLITITVIPTAAHYDVEINSDIRLRPSLGRWVAIMEMAELVRETVGEILDSYAYLV